MDERNIISSATKPDEERSYRSRNRGKDTGKKEN
jgi:hypothetical protein